MLKEFLQSNFGLENIDITLQGVIMAVVIILVTRIFLFLFFRFVLRKIFLKRKIDKGKQFSVQQLIKYFAYTIAFIAAINAVGINVSYILAGSAALLVGVGLGLQQTFNDFFSGLILLFEGSIRKGDIVEIETLIGRVQKIGMRSSIVETRDQIKIIVPNSKLVVDNVINWSHENTRQTRFQIKVGVAYGTSVPLVINIMRQCAGRHPDVSAKPNPIVQFKEFGDSALIFELNFWSPVLMQIENVKSDIRILIEEEFRRNNVRIPFPQRDLHIFRTNIPDELRAD